MGDLIQNVCVGIVVAEAVVVLVIAVSIVLAGKED